VVTFSAADDDDDDDDPTAIKTCEVTASLLHSISLKISKDNLDRWFT
jgi:hypothetical protein